MYLQWQKDSKDQVYSLQSILMVNHQQYIIYNVNTHINHSMNHVITLQSNLMTVTMLIFKQMMTAEFRFSSFSVM